MIGQPAEEIGAGAMMMLNEGLYSKFPVPDVGIALHSSPTILSGKVGFGKGYIMANTESVDITVFGEGAHGSGICFSIIGHLSSESSPLGLSIYCVILVL